MSSTCCCSAKMDVQQGMSCKREEFATIRHNDLGGIAANLLSNVCNNVEIKPKLLPITGESFSNRTTITRTEARLDTRSRRFWVRGQQTFFDVKVFDLKWEREKEAVQWEGFTNWARKLHPVGIFDMWRYESRMEYVL